MVKVDGSGDAASLVQVRDLDKTYRRGGEDIHVLQGLNLDVSKGEFVATARCHRGEIVVKKYAREDARRV